MVLEKPSYRYHGRLHPALRPLADRPQWICWTYVHDPARNKWNKPPLSAHTGRKARGGATNPENWGTYEQALATQQRLKLAGVGYVLTRDDGLTGVDIDHCISDSGSYNEIAATILEIGETYAEVSPSGHGIRLWILGKYAGGVIKKDGPGIEVYTELRYLTVTCEHIEDSPEAISEAPRTLAYLQHLASLDQPDPKPSPPLPRADGGDFFKTVNAASLANLDRWVPILHPTARKQATGAWRITSHALGRALEEDLAYHPDGIRDHGEEHGLTPIDAVIRFGSAAGAPDAALWLCHRMGLEPAALGWHGGGQPHAVLKNVKDNTRPATEPVGSLIETAAETTLPTTVDTVIKDVIGSRDLIAIYGPSGAGKTFTALDAAFHAALGQPWFDKRVRHAVAVLYVNLEGAKGFRARVIAYREHLGNPGSMFARITVPPMLNKSPAGNEGVQLVVKAAEELSKRNGTPVGLIVIDTLARAIAGDDENTAQDMAAFIARTQAITEATGAAVVVVHHSGKDDARGMRGSSALFAACDTVIKVEAMGESRTVSAEKVKDGEMGVIGSFKLERKVLGYDEDGDEITSCVVAPSNTPVERRPGRPKGSRMQDLALRAIELAIEEHGIKHTGTSVIPPGVRTVTFDQVMIYASQNGAVNAERPLFKQREDLRVRLARLSEKIKIGCWGELVWKLNE